MDTWFPSLLATGFCVFIVVVFIGGMIALVVWSVKAGNRRRRERQHLFASMATSCGWQWVESNNDLVRRWTGAPFGRGSTRRTGNVVSGVHNGHEFVFFDYSYTTSSTDGQGNSTTQTHPYSVYAVRLPAPAPYLQVNQKGLFAKLGAALGFERFTLGQPAFDQTLKASTSHPQFARDVLSPDVVRLALTHQDVPWRIEGQDILCWTAGSHTPEVAVTRLFFLEHLLAAVSAQVWDRLRAGT